METVKEYVVFHETKWNDVFDKNGNVVTPRTNSYFLEGFWGLNDCKDWVAEGNKKGSKKGAIRLEDVFAVCKDKLVPLEMCAPCDNETIIICVKTANNLHRWKEVLTKEDAETFIANFGNVVESFACTAMDIEILE